MTSILIALSILGSCTQEYDEPNFEVQSDDIISSYSANNVLISGQIRQASNMKITLEAPLMQSKGKNIELSSDSLDGNGHFEMNTSIPGLGYFMLKIYGESVDSIELTLSPGDAITIDTQKDSIYEAISVDGVIWSKDLEAYQAIRAKQNPNCAF